MRDDATLRFMFVAAAFYGLLAFEGLFLAIRPVNALSRCTDWTVGHVQSGTLGWLAMIVFGSLYTLVPHLAGQDRMRWPRAVCCSLPATAGWAPKAISASACLKSPSA